MKVCNDPSIKELSEVSGEGCVSIYMPTNYGRVGGMQNMIRFRNLLKASSAKLAKTLNDQKLRELMQPLWQLSRDALFWSRQGKGVSIFRAPHYFRILNYNRPFEEEVIVSHRFQLRPLLSIMNSARNFYVLAISLKSVRLFYGSQDAINEVPVEGLDLSLRDYIGSSDRERHMSAIGTQKLSGPGGKRFFSSLFHSYDHKNAKRKRDIVSYLRLVDSKVAERLASDRDAPVLLAGLAEHVFAFRKVSKLPGIYQHSVVCHAENLTAQELLRESLKVLPPANVKMMTNLPNERDATLDDTIAYASCGYTPLLHRFQTMTLN